MKPLILAFYGLTTVGSLCAETPSWQPSPGHAQMPIWPDEAVPDAQPVKWPEEIRTLEDPKWLVAGRPWVEVNSVSRPTMTVYSPEGENTGTAVVVFPGGGYEVLAIDLEGTEVADWLTVDAADKISCRPNFAVALYPGHLSLAADSTELNPDIRSRITLQTPPTFLLQNEDDHVDRVEDSLSYYVALKKVGVPVEMHLYAQGGHAFGLRRTKFPVTRWPELVKTWLVTIGMISE
jgi:hypothetical protein